MVYEFKFADVGEGIVEGEIVKWLVKEGDVIKENQNIVQIETDKAVVDIPTPKSGKVLKLHFKEGDEVKVGETLISISGEGEKVEETKKEDKTEEVKEVSKKKSVSVVGELEDADDKEKSLLTKEEKIDIKKTDKVIKGSDEVLAMPRVRILAEKLGVDLSKFKGKITEEDVLTSSKNGVKENLKTEVKEKPKIVKKYDMFGYIDHVPLKGIRKTTARRMLESVKSVAPVTAFIDADVTKLWSIREKEKKIAEKKKISLTFMPFIIKSTIAGLKENKVLNSTMTEDEIIIKKYYNIGVAVATEAGLLVPVVKGADKKSILDLAKEISELGGKAHKRKLDIMDLKGGTFTITNWGSIGGTYGTPIINPPEAAILGVGRIFDRVVMDKKGKIENRKILPLSLTFDHRILDGAEAAKFLNVVVKHLEDPALLLIEMGE